MKIIIISYYLHTLLILFNTAFQSAFSQVLLQYNECNINHCVSCDKGTILCTQCEKGFYFEREQLLCLPDLTCPLGQFKSNQNQDCKDCHFRCKSCFGSKLVDCTHCVDGYVFSRNVWRTGSQRFCVSCGVNNCKICFSRGICNICADGFILNKETELCDPCSVNNCKECKTNPAVCDLCFSSYSLLTTIENVQVCVLKGDCSQGFYKDTDGSCISCDISCQHCFGPGSDKCYYCQFGFYLNGDSCQKCNSSCQTCQYSSNYCTSCHPQFVLNGRECQQNCESVIGSKEYIKNGKCEPCHKFCDQCSNFQECTKCVTADFKLVNGECQYKDQLCNFQNSCKTCKNNENLRNKSCVKTCQNSEYIQYDPIYGIKTCMPWSKKNYYQIKSPYPCSKCKDRFTCLACASSQFSLQNGKCFDSGYAIQNCSEGYAETNDLCQQRCPDQFKLSRDYCHCNFICGDCQFFDNSKIGQCSCNTQSLILSNGKCETQCPFSTKSCVYSCSINQYTQISINKIECVQNCDQGFDKFNGRVCGNITCIRGTYFDYDHYLNQINYKVDLNDLSIFCKPCDPSCAACNGKLNTNCLKCIDNYFMQERNQKTYCQPKCDDGYEQTNLLLSDNTYLPKCKVCTTSCSSCISTKYKQIQSLFNTSKKNAPTSLLFDCLDSCNTKLDYSNKICKLQTTANIYFKQKEKIENRFSNQFNIDVILSLNITDLKPSCIFESGYYYKLKQSNIEIEEYQTTINPYYMVEGKTYSVSCSGENTYFFLQQIEKIQIYELKGNFSFNQESGFANVDTFSFIPNFYLSDIDKKKYVIKYKIEFQDRYYYQLLNQTFQFTQDYQNDNNSTLTENSQYIFNITFSEINRPIPVYVFLNIVVSNYNHYSFNKIISLKPSNKINNLDVISPALNNIISFASIQNNFKLNITEFDKFINDLKNSTLIPNLDKGQMIDIIMQKNKQDGSYFNQSISCEQVSDCSGHGKCKTKIISYFERCDCDSGYVGESCAWKTVDLQIVQQISSNFLKITQQMIFGNKQKDLNIAFNLLNDLVQIRDVFQDNIGVLLDFLWEDWLDYIDDPLNFQIKQLKLIGYAINLYRKFLYRDLYYFEIKRHIQKTLQRNGTFLNLGQQESYSFNNINIYFKDLNSSNFLQDLFVQQKDIYQNQWKVTIPIQNLSNLESQYYLQIIDLPNDLYYSNDTPFNTFVASSYIQVSIRKKSNSSEIFPIKEFSKPIEIVFKKLVIYNHF